jgi:hypothetical protein
MDFLSLFTWRKRIGVCGAVILGLTLAFTVDGMIAGGRKDPNAFNLLPGQSLQLSDTMPRGAERLEDLFLKASTPKISLHLTETFSGFWLGGTLWRAELALPSTLPSGDYDVTMLYQNGTETTPRQAFHLHVLPDAAALQAAELSLTTRTFGVSPFLLAALLLPLSILPMFASYRLSRKIAKTLLEHGMAEIFRAMTSSEGQHIFFSLSAPRPLAPQAAVAVLDERGQKRLGTALIFAVTKDDVEAIMQDGVQIRPGSLAKLL